MLVAAGLGRMMLSRLNSILSSLATSWQSELQDVTVTRTAGLDERLDSMIEVGPGGSSAQVRLLVCGLRDSGNL